MGFVNIDNNNITLQQSLHRDNVLYVRWNRWKSFLCFNYIITTNQFHSTNYRKQLS